jgi:hypothetical protein
MRRKTFDVIASTGGAAVVVVLLVAGGLLMWGYSYTSNQVHNQLAMQQVYFPTRAEILSAPASSTEIPPAIRQYLLPYAGQEVLTGPQAETYADHFIAEHLSEMPYGGVYSKVSFAAMTAPKGSPAATQLAALETTVFQGTTLRAMLLEAYGFWTLGEIAFWSGITAFALAGLLGVLVGFGIWHARRTPEDAELLVHEAQRALTNA